MSNLIPEKRMDKNGRLVTKHVKPGTAPVLGNMTVPAPSLPDPRSTHIAAILEPTRSTVTRSGLQHLTKYLEACQSSTLAAAAEAVGSSDEPLVGQVISDAVYKRNEGFLLLVASSKRAWSPVASSRSESGELSEGELSHFSSTLWGVYTGMTPYETHDLYASLGSRDAKNFDAEDSIESFTMEFLGKKLDLDLHSHTSRGYYRSLEVLSADLDGVSDAMPLLMKMNRKLYTMDRDGNEVGQSLTSDQVMSVVRLSKRYPERAKSLIEFVRQRNTFDEGPAEEFLKSSATSLSSGLL